MSIWTPHDRESLSFPGMRPAAEDKGSNLKEGKSLLAFLAGDNHCEPP